jgi:ABC-2 type transport system permease protein
VNLFLRELAAYRKSTLTWTVSLAGLVVLFMAMYPGFSSDVEGLKNVLEQFPPAIKAAFNLTADTFLTAAGFFGYVLGFGILAGAIQAMNLGTGVISKEVAGKTADFLLSKPLTRTRIITSKLLAVFVAIVVTNVVFVAVSYAGIAALAPDEFEPTTILLLASTLFLVQMVFLALGALMGVVIPKVKSVVSVSLPTVFGFYILGALGDVLGNDEVRYVSPFRYFDPQYIIKNQAFESKYLVIAAAIVVVSLVLSYAIFLKKDVQSST